MNPSAAVIALKDSFATERTLPLKWRLSQLAAMHAMLIENRREFERALHADLGKSGVEAWSTELAQTIAEIKYAQKHLTRWLREKRVRTPLSLSPASSKIVYDPLGTVVIIAPWNYPVQLLLSPLVGALAGGNCAVLKPSELAPHVANLFAELVPRYFDTCAVQVVTGGADVVGELIRALPDKVFFTGSSRVGAILATQCAELLIPIELELGGKSPVYVHQDADLRVAAKRIVWAKFTNAGQTCVAPDYVCVQQGVATKFTKMLAQEVRRAYGKNPQKSRAYGRIITTRHAERLAAMQTSSEGAKIICGGGADPQKRYVEPTIIFGVGENHPAMQEEIFGPILPVLPVADWSEAAALIKQREKPLAAYVFTRSKRVAREFLRTVPSGGAAINAALIHIASPYLPFGGVGASGQGNYHGRWSFQAFTHERAVLAKPLRPDTLSLLYAPVGKTAEFLMRHILLPAGSPAKQAKRQAKKQNRASRKAQKRTL